MSFEEPLPYDIGHPDVDLVRLVNSGEIPRCQVLDIGMGHGHDSVFLLDKGFDVIGVDLNPAAIRRARENASHHGFFGYFQRGDVRDLPIEDGYIDFAFDLGCIQSLAPHDQERAMEQVRRVLGRKGLLLLKMQKEGPHGVSAERFQTLIGGFRPVQQWESTLEGPVAHPSFAALLAKR